MLRKFIAVARQQIFGLLALFVALGGMSYAVATGSIDSREIKNNTIRSKDIRNRQVRSSDVRDRSLLAKDFKSGQLPGSLSGYETRYASISRPGNDLVLEQTALCSSGKRVLGGGWQVSNLETHGGNTFGAADVVHRDGPYFNVRQGWSVWLEFKADPDITQRTLRVWTICAD